ncbi:MAG: hypothetical protein A2Y53_00010 [Chloroflexi bacterium RBG_16_47_49]|nr:MAG: hypothetical protein A2Y53_00010 [Chloroflexi bacterium RBG_16_47_49]
MSPCYQNGKMGDEEMDETCMWELHDGYEEEIWETECDNSFFFSAGRPQEDGFLYCPYCGKLIAILE